MTKTKEDIARELREARSAAGLRQAEVAIAAGVSRSTVHRAETTGDITATTLFKLWRVFEPSTNGGSDDDGAATA